MIRVLIVDDHDIVREGLKQIVSETTDIRIEGEAKTGSEALDLVRQGCWDVVVLDLNLPDRGGLELIPHLRQVAPGTPLLVLTMHREESYASRALKAGAAGYISKDRAREYLVEAIRRLAGGQTFITPALAERLAFELVRKGDRKPHEQLSDREFQILRMIATGAPPRQIAAELNLSVKTVATHRTRILQKMSLRNNAELVQYALQNGLLE